MTELSLAQIQFYVGFSIPNWILGSMNSVSVFLPSYLSFLLHSAGFLFLSEFGPELLFHLCRPQGIFCQTSLLWVSLTEQWRSSRGCF